MFNIVSRALFGRENSLSSAPNLVSSAKTKSVSLRWHKNNRLAIASAMHRGAYWEISESAPGSALEGALGNWGAPGGAPEGAQENWGCPSRGRSFC